MLLGCVLFWAAVGKALAHDLDCKGQPVDRWTKLGCCGDADAILLGFDQVAGPDKNGVWRVVIDGAYHAVVDNYGQPIPMAPARDGCYRVWYRRQHVGSATARQSAGDRDHFHDHQSRVGSFARPGADCSL